MYFSKNSSWLCQERFYSASFKQAAFWTEVNPFSTTKLNNKCFNPTGEICSADEAGKKAIIYHSHNGCIYRHWFCCREQTKAAESMFKGNWSFIYFLWKADLLRPNGFFQLRWQIHLLRDKFLPPIWTRTYALVGNTVATFMLYYSIYCVRNVTHSVTTLLHKYFTVFHFKLLLAERIVYYVQEHQNYRRLSVS